MTDKAYFAPTSTAQTVYSIPIRNLWYMLLYAWKETPRSPYWNMVDTEESPSLDALLASVLTEIVKQRLRIGLGCDYMTEQRLLRGIRGRIHFTKSLKQRAFERGQAFCEFEKFSINAPKNQIIRSTLFHLSQVGQFGPDQKQADKLRHNIRRLVRTLEGIDLVDLTPDFIHRQQIERQDHDYRIMLAICDLLLQRRLPTEEGGQIYVTQLERDRLVLHRLYEKFVTNFYRYHLRHWDIKPQMKLLWHEKLPNPHLPIMRPDLRFKEKSTGRILILDTKFTAKSLKENRWGKEMYDSSHLYQLYTYLRTQAHLSDQHRKASGILLYPAIDSELSEKIELQGHQIRIECVDLAAPWQTIQQRLVDMIEVHT